MGTTQTPNREQLHRIKRVEREQPREQQTTRLNARGTRPKWTTQSPAKCSKNRPRIRRRPIARQTADSSDRTTNRDTARFVSKKKSKNKRKKIQTQSNRKTTRGCLPLRVLQVQIRRTPKSRTRWRI